MLGNEKRTAHVNFRSIQGKLLFAFLSLSLVPLILLGILAYTQSQAALQQRVTQELDRLASIEISILEQALLKFRQDINVVVGAARIKSMQFDQAKAAIDLYYKEWGIYETIFTLTPDGKSLATSDNKPLSLADREYFQRAMKGESNISPPIVSKASGNVVIAIAAPIVVDNKIVGVAGSTVQVKYLGSLLAGALTGQTGDAYLVNQQGYLISPSRFEKDLINSGEIKTQTALELKIDTLASREAIAGKNGISEYLNYHKVPVLGAYHWLVD
jgi:hypothetical protein